MIFAEVKERNSGGNFFRYHIEQFSLVIIDMQIIQNGSFHVQLAFLNIKALLKIFVKLLGNLFSHLNARWSVELAPEKDSQILHEFLLLFIEQSVKEVGVCSGDHGQSGVLQITTVYSVQDVKVFTCVALSDCVIVGVFKFLFTYSA